MEIDTKLYQVNINNFELKEIIDQLNTDLTLLSSILNTYDYYEDYPVSSLLTDDILNKINNFTQGIFEKTLNIRYIFTEDVLDNLAKVRNLLSEQLYYCTFNEANCNVWLVVAKINGFIYGATCVFYNPTISSDILLQGISRAFIPSLLEIISPGILSTLPRLNSLLQPLVESIGRSVGAEKIYVAPIANQGNILEKHYGYIPDRTILFPCAMIRGGDIISKNLSKFHTYSKSITYDSTEL